VSESSVIEAIPNTEKAPSSRTAGTSVMSSAAKPAIVVTPAIRTGATRCSRERVTAVAASGLDTASSS
jgi:hypothetical protein